MDTTCEITSERVNLLLNIGIHVFILFCFLSIFFTFYVSDLSRDALNKELDENITHMINGKIAELTQDQRNAIRNGLKQVPLTKIISIYNYLEKYTF